MIALKSNILRFFVGSLANESHRNSRRPPRQQIRHHVAQAAAFPLVEGTIPRGGKGLAVGQYAQIHRVFSSSEIQDFARVSGDHNPLHQPPDRRYLPGHLSDVLDGHPLIKVEENGRTTEVVHGILVSSLFSCIFGTLIPGSVYRSQTLDFRRAVYAGESVLGRVQILGIEKQRRLDGLIVRCSTQVTKEGKECVRGEADVWIPQGTENGE